MPCDCIIARIFQSTLLQEERRYANDFFSIKRQFQSTLLQEERRLSSESSLDYFYNFNPRSYKRSDVEWNILYVNPNSISIHAPTRGATGNG